MATKIRFEFLTAGFRELLMSDAVADEVMTAARKIAVRATADAITDPRTHSAAALYEAKGPRRGGYGGGRMIAYVASENKAATKDQFQNARLESVIWEVAE